MTSARLNALSLAVAIAISSSIINTQAMAGRRLQIKSVYFQEHVELTRIGVMVKPTLGEDRQPIPKSFTTTYTYPDQPGDRPYLFDSIGFTASFAIGSGTSIVDVFETGENGVARKYTKILKMGDEGVFRFTHDLAEKELVIEVRGGITDKGSVEVIRSQSDRALEPLTKIASPSRLAELLNLVDLMAGHLGRSDHYVPLATIEVEKVTVNGRTFMRLLAAGDQPPELQRLGQSLFVNDDVLLAAAASAYIQVYILGEDLQQQALNELLAHSKPVGYVVHVEDDTQVYPVPAGYPKLEVSETPGEVIVFHGQMQSPDDIAFVESLYNLWEKAEGNNPARAVAAWVKKYDVKAYQSVIRSRQMTLLEGLAARHHAGVNEDQPAPINEDIQAMRALANYEYLHQVLTSAIPDGIYGAAKFELTPEHIRVASSAITPTWIQIRLAKEFSFKPIFRDLLTNQYFLQNILNLKPVAVDSETNVFHDDEQFAAKVTADMTRQLIERESELEKQLATTKSKLIRVTNQLELTFKKATPAEKEKLRALQLRQQALDAALALAESAINSGKTIPCLTTFDFNDEFAPIHLQALVGDDLTFNQASRIVEIFKSLKTNFPPSPFEPVEDQPRNVIEEVQNLAHRARNEVKTGAEQYDKEIHGMAKSAIHFVEHEPEDLKDFSKYFAIHSVSGHKIIALLREGLISKIELENYMKAVRGVDGYQTVDEFEHFLDNKHGVNLPRFKAVVQMLSDEGVDEFMQSAFTPVTLTATDPAGMKESVDGMKEYAAAVIANYVLDDIAFENGRRTAAFLTNVQVTLTPYANAAGLSESDLIKAIHNTLMQAYAAAVEQQLNKYWVKPSASLVQAVTWYFSSYKPLLATRTSWQAAELSILNMSFLYLLDLTNRGDYLQRVLIPFQHWLEGFGVDLDRTGQYAYHNGIEQISEAGGLAMPLGKAASSVILLRTGSMLFARQHNANPQMFRNIFRLLPEMTKPMSSGQGVQVPLLHRVTPQKVKTLASATAGLVLGPVATVGSYAHGLILGFTYAQTFGFALASSLAFDFFMNDNKLLTQWLGGPLGRTLDRINRWTGLAETNDEYVKRMSIATPQRFSETDEAYTNRVKANGRMYGWTRHENYLQFRERRDRTMKMFENGWEKYFRENVPKWSFSHAESIPYSYTLKAFFGSQQGDDQKVHRHDKRNAPQSGFLPSASADYLN
ncbi:hypothetical protein [Endozoicomonas sp. 8E]|uniref:hypothetical protein n=1 Tax=Endozoicomonas sp. 8E TaxID=3035692 RepID=UPI002938E29E|nr:hypothetical protein [Endozoicomonas sp. 8E]WOG29546.1 hypothetical protein P6910_07820 [Endozoicomonas sp. 8E]